MKKDLLHYVLNVVTFFVLTFAVYFGYLQYLWHTDVSCLGFVILAVYTVTSLTTMFDSTYSEKVVEEIGDLLPGLGLIGTIVGFIVLFSVLKSVNVSSASDFKDLITPILMGAGTALQTTLLGVGGNVLLRVQVMLKK